MAGEQARVKVDAAAGGAGDIDIDRPVDAVLGRRRGSSQGSRDGEAQQPNPRHDRFLRRFVYS
jgi:hypothetical protein